MKPLLALLALAPIMVSAGKPLSISLSPSSQTITEGQGATLLLGKSGGNGKVTAAHITTSDGWSGSVIPGNSFTIPTADDALINGTRTITVTAIASTGATARATFTVLDNDVAPVPPTTTWTKCADENGTCTISGTATVRYGAGSTWLTRTVTGSIACDNSTWTDPLPGIVKECDTDGAVAAPAPIPAPTGSWVPAPLTVGGYAWLKNGGTCCNGLIVKIVDGGMTGDQNHPQHWWAYVYYADPSGNFPAKDPYWSTTWMYGFDDGLQGVS